MTLPGGREIDSSRGILGLSTIQRWVHDVMYELAFMVFLGACLVLGVWVLVRGWSPRRGGPFPEVPDASPTATPIDAPGISPPYSSLDPYAPPKQPVERARTDRPGTPD